MTLQLKREYLFEVPLHLQNVGCGHQDHLHHVVVPQVPVVEHNLGSLLHDGPRGIEARPRKVHPDDRIIPVY